MRNNGINFKSPKYMIPALVFLPTVFLGYQVIGMFDFEKPVEKAVETVGINTDIPDAQLDGGIKSKYQNMIEDYGKVMDHVAVKNLNEEIKKDMSSESLYSDEELRVLDSLERVKSDNIKMLEELRKQTVEKSAENNVASSEVSGMTADQEALAQQLDKLQKIASGEYKSPEQIAQEKAEAELKAIKEAEAERLRKEREEAEAPRKVEKATSGNEDYFNTVGKSEENSQLIKAIVDERLKVKDGSRIRLRLLDDIMIEGNVVPKGSYLYALVGGFSAQRVKATVNSILVGNKHIKVSLKVYDNDALEGFYVPESAFRDLAKEAASQSMGQSINVNSNGDQSVESFAMQTLQNVYQSASSAISNNIKKNKAKIKYNTFVYLINEN